VLHRKKKEKKLIAFRILDELDVTLIKPGINPKAACTQALKLITVLKGLTAGILRDET
jgi:hypothetical protein